ncbi:MAG TPA: Maf family protein [Candidatus Acidoferrales bacterium]|nr:Maf family protein [Candidatus Acidoferrales bacterium]
MKLILASSSPRRAEILRNAGFDFEVLPTNVDESQRHGEYATNFVRRLAEEKARAVAQLVAAKSHDGSAIIVAADTTVELEGEILGKPSSAENARAMIRRLSGRTHEVLTGLAVLPVSGVRFRVVVESTRVSFAPISDSEIEAYIQSGEPLDKAGAYAIQGRGGKFITRIEGCYFNVMGLPLARLYAILRELSTERS